MDIDNFGNRVVKLAFTLDTTCPWCYIGWRETETAIHMAEANDLPLRFEVEFKPYRLDPTLPITEPVEKDQHYSTRFGVERYQKMQSAIVSRGEEIDIDFNFAGLVRRNGSCHRLLRYAYEIQSELNPTGSYQSGYAVAARLINEIFAGFFERAEDIGDPDVLAQYCENADLMSRDEALAFIDSAAFADEVELLIDEATSEGITGVPFTVINSKWAVVGGQKANTIYSIFEKLAQA